MLNLRHQYSIPSQHKKTYIFQDVDLFTNISTPPTYTTAVLFKNIVKEVKLSDLRSELANAFIPDQISGLSARCNVNHETGLIRNTCFLKYALIKGSMPPSSTESTFPVSTPVR